MSKRTAFLQAALSSDNSECILWPFAVRASWATPMENMADAIAHGSLKGGGRYRQRLTPADVATIRSSARSLISLGREFGLEPAYIGKVRRGECHVG